MQRVTMQDIANELGISRNTVSKAMNNTGSLAAATRERILRKAVEMGYKQFSYIHAFADDAAAYRQTDRGDIALLRGSAGVSASYVSPLADRIRKELLASGYTLHSYRVKRENLLQRTLPAGFDPGQVRAVLCAELFDRDYDEMICALGLPAVFVDGPNKRGGFNLPADQLYMENTSVITRFVNEMLVRGWRRIGFIGDHESCQSQYERYTAFRCAMLMAGAPVEERFCIKAGLPGETEAALSALSDFPEVFVCASDTAAVEAVRTLEKRGLSVPGNVLVCGFGDSPESRSMTPSLTTVRIHTGVMAASAVQLLLSRIDEPQLDNRVIHTETTLIYRESTRS